MPIVRTFAYNVAGGLLWVAILLYGGYWFGGLKFVKEHFAVVELAIIILSVMPMVIEFLRARKKV